MAGRGEEAASFDEVEDGGIRVLRLSGAWTIACLRTLDSRLRAIQGTHGSELHVDFAGLTQMDTTGAWLICRTVENLGWQGTRTQLLNVTEVQQKLLDRVSHSYEPCDLDRPRPDIWSSLFGRVGMGVENTGRELVQIVGFLGLILQTLPRCLLTFTRLRLTPLAAHMEQAGFNAIPIILTINFLVGAVITFMGADILSQFGASHLVVNMIAYGFPREFAVLLTAIMVAGRSGSAFTAQLGSMKVREEIDAMRTIGIGPVEALVVPRILALIITMPLLTFLANLAGIAGAVVAAWANLDMTPSLFIQQLKANSMNENLWVGLIKSLFFAFAIGVIGCFQGFQVTGSAESVGRRTTLSVVEGIFTVIVLDALFAIFFLQIGWRGYVQA